MISYRLEIEALLALGIVGRDGYGLEIPGMADGATVGNAYYFVDRNLKISRPEEELRVSSLRCKLS